MMSEKFKFESLELTKDEKGKISDYAETATENHRKIKANEINTKPAQKDMFEYDGMSEPEFVSQIKKYIRQVSLVGDDVIREIEEKPGYLDEFLKKIKTNPFLADAIMDNPTYGLELFLKWWKLDELSKENIKFLFDTRKEILKDNPKIDHKSLEFHQVIQEKMKGRKKNPELVTKLEEIGIKIERWPFLDDLIPEISREVPVMSQEDERVVEFGLHSLKDLLASKEKEDLPTVIIFPETSGRLLSYAVTPILREIYKNKGVKFPTLNFISPVRSPDKESTQYFTEDYKKEVDVLKKEIEHVEEQMKKQKESDLDKDVATLRDKHRNTVGWTKSLKERFKEILEWSAHGDVLVIDDYLNDGETLSQLESLEKMIYPGRKLSFFVFYDGRDARKLKNGNPVKYFNVGLGAHELENVEIKKDKNGWPVYEAKELMTFEGFSFRGVDYLDYKHNKYKKEKVIGVKKPSSPGKYAILSQRANYRKMKNLREEMKKNAEKVLSNPNFNKNDEIKRLPRHFPFW